MIYNVTWYFTEGENMNFEEKLKHDVLAEIFAQELYLSQLKEFNQILNPVKPKRKYKKRKISSPADSALKKRSSQELMSTTKVKVEEKPFVTTDTYGI
jgi:hypothetical protein